MRRIRFVRTVRVLEIPHVSRIHKHCPGKHPEHRETIFNVCLKFHISCLVRNHKGRVLRRESRSETACLPSAHAVGSSCIEMFLKWKCRGVSVGISSTCLNPCSESLLVILAESPCLAERQFRTYILRIRSVPNHSGAIAVFLHQTLERTQNVT